jgi:hypothetical protein
MDVLEVTAEEPGKLRHGGGPGPSD